MASRSASARVLRAVVVGALLLPVLATPLACGRAAPAPALTEPATSDGRGPPAAPLEPPAKGNATEATAVVFENVKVFDGKSSALTGSTTVLVIGNHIEKIGGAPAISRNATVIHGHGRTLMPGLIDVHWHA